MPSGLVSWVNTRLRIKKMTTPEDVVSKKLKRAEKEALATLKKYGFPLEVNDIWLSKDARFKDASDRDRQLISAAVNVLVSVRQVYDRWAQGDHIGALRFMAYVEQGPKLLDNTYRGAKTIKAASDGGRAKAAAQRPERDKGYAELRQRAKKLRAANPKLSVNAIALILETKGFGKASTIRKKISDLKPTQK